MKRLLFIALCIWFGVPALSQSPVSTNARQIHDSAIVVDTHADTPQRFLDGNFDIGSTDPSDTGHISLDKARAGNLGAEFFSIWVEPETNQGHYVRHTLDLIDSVYEQAARHPDRMMMAFSAADIERAHREHKLAALLGIEGTAAFGAASLALLRFTGGPWHAGFFLALSVLAWGVAPVGIAVWRLRRADV